MSFEAEPHPALLCPFATSDGSSFLEEACLPLGAVGLYPFAILVSPLPCSSSPALGWPLFSDAVVPVVLVWFLWFPATLLLRKATSGHSALHIRCRSEGSSRDACWVDRMCVFIGACIERLLHAEIGGPL